MKIGVVNRGEPAVRFFAAIGAMRHRLGQGAPEAVALYTDADAGALHVRRAGQAVRLGAQRSDWLDAQKVARCLLEAGCDAAWLGWGFASEDADFAATLEDAGLILLAPRPETMRLLGDKIRAKKLAESLGVPVAAWRVVDDLDPTALARAAAHVGFPLMVKAAAGGGGRGIRRVERAEDLAEALRRAREEAERSFGGGGLMLERCVDNARHIEVQILGDGEGNVRVVGSRDCSMQRRRQKLIEECPAPDLPEAVERQLFESAERLAQAVRYRSAGTVEFLYTPEADAAQALAFLEVNTRLQVEHPVTEEVFGLDLVRCQIELAMGLPLPPPAQARGWAVEARLCAEDPYAQFAPAPGRLVRLNWPVGPGLRVDTGFAQGDRLSAEFDPLIAKIIAWGPDRPSALARLAHGLQQTRIVVEGGRTNLDFLQGLLALPSLRAGTVRTDLLDNLCLTPPPGAVEAQLAAAIDRFLGAGDRRADEPERHVVEVGQPLRVYRTGPERFRVLGEGGGLTLGWISAPGEGAWLVLGGRRVHVEHVPGDSTYVIDGSPHRVAQATGGAVVAPAAGLVLEIFAREGAQVKAGQCVAILESMKMEVRVEAPAAGQVRQIAVDVGALVRPGQWLMQLAHTTQARPKTQALPMGPAEAGPGLAERLCDLLLGWDLEPSQLAVDLETIDAAAAAQILPIYLKTAQLFAPRGQRRRALSQGTADTLTVARLFETLRAGEAQALPEARREAVLRVLAHHDVQSLRPSAKLHDALLRLERARRRFVQMTPIATAALAQVAQLPVTLLDGLMTLDASLCGPVIDAAARARHRLFEAPSAQQLQERSRILAEQLLSQLEAQSTAAGSSEERDWTALTEAAEALLTELIPPAIAGRPVAVEAVARRLEWVHPEQPVWPCALNLPGGQRVVGYRVGDEAGPVVFVSSAAQAPILLASLGDLRTQRLVLVTRSETQRPAVLLEALRPTGPLPAGWGELCLLLNVPSAPLWVRRFRPDGQERQERRDILPTTARRFTLHSLRNFQVERLDRGQEVVLIKATAHENPDDVRLLAYGEVRSLQRRRGPPLHLPEVDRVFYQAVRALQEARERHDPRRRLHWNRLTLVILPVVPLGPEAVRLYMGRLGPATERLGLDKVVVVGRFADASAPDGVGPWLEITIRDRGGPERSVTVSARSDAPMAPLTRYEQQVVAARRRGLVYPYEIIAGLEGSPKGSRGRFIELDLDEAQRLVAVGSRAPGLNRAAVVVGVHHGPGEAAQTAPGLRVVLLSDPTQAMGALAEAECRRIIAALDLAQTLRAPVEWVAVSAGARIDWQTGTENLDWTARVLQRIVAFTQAGGEIDVIVPGICVGAQAYWNAEATMLMHTRGLLIMTARGAMVLTGKRALDASGSVSAEDDYALGGYAAIMGPNGQVQAYAEDLTAAWRLLLRYRRLTWVPPGMGRAPWHETADDIDRDMGLSAYPGEWGAAEGTQTAHGFTQVGDLFSAQHNPDRKKPFAVRPVMAALVDQDCEHLERWGAWLGAETAVVWEARIGGYAATVVGIDNQPVARLGARVSDGPTTFAGGTLYPQASRKVARALNAASGRRPVVVLANLSGFDGSPESLAQWQLEYGAEIGRAVVNFKGPILFVVLSRYHGGAYVVFSKALNPQLAAVALEGSHASVIGGAPAAAVVFVGEVRRQVQAAGGSAEAKARITAQLAARFDRIHSVQRAQEVGSIDSVISVAALRPWVVARLAADYMRNAGEAEPGGLGRFDERLAQALAALNR